MGPVWHHGCTRMGVLINLLNPASLPAQSVNIAATPAGASTFASTLAAQQPSPKNGTLPMPDTNVNGASELKVPASPPAQNATGATTPKSATAFVGELAVSPQTSTTTQPQVNSSVPTLDPKGDRPSQADTTVDNAEESSATSAASTQCANVAIAIVNGHAVASKAVSPIQAPSASTPQLSQVAQPASHSPAQFSTTVAGVTGRTVVPSLHAQAKKSSSAPAVVADKSSGVTGVVTIPAVPQAAALATPLDAGALPSAAPTSPAQPVIPTSRADQSTSTIGAGQTLVVNTSTSSQAFAGSASTTSEVFAGSAGLVLTGFGADTAAAVEPASAAQVLAGTVPVVAGPAVASSEIDSADTAGDVAATDATATGATATGAIATVDAPALVAQTLSAAATASAPDAVTLPAVSSDPHALTGVSRPTTDAIRSVTHSDRSTTSTSGNEGTPSETKAEANSIDNAAQATVNAPAAPLSPQVVALNPAATPMVQPDLNAVTQASGSGDTSTTTSTPAVDPASLNIVSTDSSLKTTGREPGAAGVSGPGSSIAATASSSSPAKSATSAVATLAAAVQPSSSHAVTLGEASTGAALGTTAAPTAALGDSHADSGSAQNTPQTLPTNTLAHAAAPTLSSAQLIQSIHQTQMRIGLNSNEFGNISISTSIANQTLTAQISLDHSALGHVLSAQLPSIEEKLGGAYGLQTRVEIRDAGTQSGGNSGGSSERRDANRNSASSFSGSSIGGVSQDTGNIAYNSMPTSSSTGGRLDITI